MSGIEQAARIIREGGLVAFPTETVYGLGADALNPLAVARVFEVKNRPTFDPLIVHVGDLRGAMDLVREFPPKALELAQKFWPGPLTLVLLKNEKVLDLVTASLPTVAVRVPDHPLARELLRLSGRPIAAPSANPFGQVSPTTTEHVRKSLGDKVDLILDGGPCRVGVESTVLSLAGGPPVLLRPGGIPLEEIKALVGEVAISTSAAKTPLAPGQLLQHYAPRTPLVLLESSQAPPPAKRVGLLTLKAPPAGRDFQAVEVLSPQGDLREAAANLFAAMRRLDEQGLDLILARPVPPEGLVRAINDRLYKASQKNGSDSF